MAGGRLQESGTKKNVRPQRQRKQKKGAQQADTMPAHAQQRHAPPHLGDWRRHGGRCVACQSSTSSSAADCTGVALGVGGSAGEGDAAGALDANAPATREPQSEEKKKKRKEKMKRKRTKKEKEHTQTQWAGRAAHQSLQSLPAQSSEPGSVPPQRAGGRGCGRGRGRGSRRPRTTAGARQERENGRGNKRMNA